MGSLGASFSHILCTAEPSLRIFSSNCITAISVLKHLCLTETNTLSTNTQQKKLQTNSVSQTADKNETQSKVIQKPKPTYY